MFSPKATRQRLGPDSLAILNHYGQLQLKNVHFSVHRESRGPNLAGVDGPLRFDAATQELRENKLLWTDYRAGAVEGGDAFGMHATEFGWLVIGGLWRALRQSNESRTAAQQRSTLSLGASRTAVVGLTGKPASKRRLRRSKKR